MAAAAISCRAGQTREIFSYRVAKYYHPAGGGKKAGGAGTDIVRRTMGTETGLFYQALRRRERFAARYVRVGW